MVSIEPLQACIGRAGVYSYISSNVVLAGPPVRVWDAGDRSDAREQVTVELHVESRSSRRRGRLVRSDYLAGGIMHNRPHTANHWGNLVCAWPQELGVGLGGSVVVDVVLEEHHVEVRPR